MIMTSSYLESKILDLEARLRAENDQNMNDSSSSELSSGFGSRPGSGRRPRILIGSSGGTPTRLRKQYDFLGSNGQPPSVDSSEIIAKMKEITKMSGIITIDGMKYTTGINDLEKLGDLGSGTCGHVVKMLHRPSNSVVAVKQMTWSGDSEENKRIHKDLEVVLKCDNPYIVSCYGCFINDADVWICMELMSTSFDKLSKLVGGPLPEDIIGMVALSTVQALHYLKVRHEWMHKDIKPSNILLDSRGNIKLCDFGISGRLVNSKAKSGNAGCAAYMAPERISPGTTGHRDYDVRADVWSLGISLVEMATGTFPYQGCKSEFEILSSILNQDPPKLPNNNNFSLEFHSFIEACLRKNYHQRPKYNKLLEHPFLQRYASKNVDVAAWFAQVQRNDSKNVPDQLETKLENNKKSEHISRKKETKIKNESDGLKSIWNSIMRSPLFHRRKKSLEQPTLLMMSPPLGNVTTPSGNMMTPSPPTTPSFSTSSQVAGNTSPLVLQRFIHQQMQHVNGSRRLNRSSSISPTLRQFDALAQELKNLRLDSTPVHRNTSPSPEPPPRINKMVSPLLLRRIAYNNAPDSYHFTPSHSFQRYGIPPQPPPRKKSLESKSVPCSPIPNHRYFKSPPWYPMDRT